MKTMTIKLSDELASRLERRAKRYGRSKSDLVRESIERDLRDETVVEEAQSAYTAMKDGIGCVDTGLTDLSTNPEHMEGFGR